MLHCIISFCLQQGSRYQRPRESARKAEGGVVAETKGPNKQVDSRDRNFDKSTGSRNMDEDEGNTTKENSLQPQQQMSKDTSARRPRDNRETERVRVNVGSREFVRGGRGRLRGSARGHGRGGHQDVYGSVSRRDVESVSEHGSVDDASSARVASATSTTLSGGMENSRSGGDRTGAQQSKTEDRKSSYDTSVGRTKVNAEDWQNDRGTAQLPADAERSKVQGVTSTRNTAAKDAGRRSEFSAQTSRRRTEFYDSRNRGQRIRQSDDSTNDVDKLQQQQPKCVVAKVSSRSSSAKDGADVEKKATESSQDIADVSSNKCLTDAAGEQTSQRKSGDII